MFLKLTREQGTLLVRSDAVLAFTEYKEAGKPCGSFVHFSDGEIRAIWVMENLDEILAALAEGHV